jgi:glycosyltransferase involved in cell wall biosynthesis
MKLVIVSTFWNSEKFIEDCIMSIKNQYFTDYVAYFIDDMSTDNSYDVAKRVIGDDYRFKLVKNTYKKFKAKNFIDVIYNNPEIDWDDVIVEIDGDDKLSDNFVLGLINKIYTNKDIWICGSKWVDDNGKGMKYGKANADKARSSSWNFSHMRTYRTFLFRSININDLIFEGDYLKAAVDLGIGIPMLEMAGNEHYYFLDEVTYIYTWHNQQSYSNNGATKDSKLQGRTAKYIYSLPPYKKLELIYPKEYTSTNVEFKYEKTSSEILNDILTKIGDSPINPNKERKINDTVKYDLVNQIINNKTIYTPAERVKEPISQNKPKNRQDVIEIKKGSLTHQAIQLKKNKPNSKNQIPNVFGGKKRI